MAIHSLRFPDLPEWAGAQDFSPLVHTHLIKAYSYIHQPPTSLKAYADAVSAIEPYLNHPMAIPQRIRAFYVMGMAFAAVDDYPASLYWIDRALDHAYNLDDPGELLDLLYLRGNISRAMLRYREAEMAYRDYLDIVEDYGEHGGSVDAPLALDALVQLAGAEFFLAHYDLADQLLSQASESARPLVSISKANHEVQLIPATIDWFRSQLFRWHQQPEQAISPAMTAGECYTRLGSPISAARSQLVIAEIKLDIAERESDPTVRHNLAEDAAPHIELAGHLTEESSDQIAQVLISLTDARFSRLVGQEKDRISLIERALNTGQQLDDEAVLAQGFTALGAEMASRGDSDAALHCYHEVRHILDGSEIPALGVWALRAAQGI